MDSELAQKIKVGRAGKKKIKVGRCGSEEKNQSGYEKLFGPKVSHPASRECALRTLRSGKRVLEPTKAKLGAPVTA